MATNQRKYQLIGKELAYLLYRLRTIERIIMRTLALKLVEVLENNHIDFFQSRRATWDHWKRTTIHSTLMISKLPDLDLQCRTRTWASSGVENGQVVLSFVKDETPSYFGSLTAVP